MNFSCFRILPTFIVASLLAVAPAAKATTISLNQDACTGTCGVGPFGSVLLVQTTATLVTVTVTLSANERFAGTGAGEALEFNILGAAVTIANVTSGFVAGGPDSASAFGSFLYSISCTLCQGGQNDNPTGPLTFTVTRASGVTITDFTKNSKGYIFAADIVGNNGNTGNVGAFGEGTPEPVTFSLMGGGLLAILLRKAHQRRS